MSTLYLAHHVNGKKLRVALKVSEANETFKDLLVREAHVLGNLRHPNIVHLYPIKTSAGRFGSSAIAKRLEGKPRYFVMEYIDGFPMDTKSFAKKFSLNWRMELFYQILTVVQYMHEKGYAHCDIKPENLILRYPPDEDQIPVPVLVDFGMATSINAVNNMWRVGGTIAYSPLEVLMEMRQPKNNPMPLIPEKIDIWALGALLFELATGRRLMPHDDVTTVTTAIQNHQLDTINKHEPEVPKELDTLVNMMLSLEPQERIKMRQIFRVFEEKIEEIRPPRVGKQTRLLPFL